MFEWEKVFYAQIPDEIQEAYTEISDVEDEQHVPENSLFNIAYTLKFIQSKSIISCIYWLNSGIRNLYNFFMQVNFLFEKI